MALAAAGIPDIAAIPAERITWPLSSRSSMRTPSRCASKTLQSDSAIGLRQVLPVQTKR